MTNARNDIPPRFPAFGDAVDTLARDALRRLDALGCAVKLAEPLAQSTVTGPPFPGRVRLVEAIAWLVTYRVADLVLERQEGRT